MQSNISINLPEKNNKKSEQKTRSPRPRRSSNDKGEKKMSSEAFLRHRNRPAVKKIEDPTKLIKKGEKPVRVFGLGGLEQIGSNMNVMEYEDDIIVIDAGMEFASDDMPGVDYIIPDVSYLVAKKKNIKGILITHGHLDHIGALKNILAPLDFPVIYTSPLTLGMIKKSLDDRDLKKLKFKLIDPDMDILKLGVFTVEFFRVNHSIPESMGFSIHTPKGLVVFSGDFKVDFTPSIDRPADLGKISRIWQEGVRLYLGESTNANKPGHSVSEKLIWENLDKVVRSYKSYRMIVSTFASNVGRIIQIINSAIRYDKVVFLAWRSMIANVQLCQELWYITAPKGMIRQLSAEAESMPAEKVLVLSTGSQGEENSALVRMATWEFKDFQLRPGDAVLLSSHTIPGNEKSVISMINNLVRLKVEVIDEPGLDTHTSGHGYQEDIKLMMSLINPEFYCPIHGEPYMRHANKKIAMVMGIPEQNILLPDNGQFIEMYDDVVFTSEKKIKLDTVMIDGKGQGHLSGEYVMKARNIMSENGVIGLIFKVDTKTKELVGNIQIESRGFVYSSEVKKIHTQIVEFAREKYRVNAKKRMDIKDNLKNIREDLGEYITKIIGRVPMLMLMYVYINREAVQNIQVEPNDEIIGMTLEEQGYND